MLLKTKGIPYHISYPIVGRITRDRTGVDNNSILIIDEKMAVEIPDGFKAVLTNFSIPDGNKFASPAVFGVITFDHLYEGDIIVIRPDGLIHTLYRVLSSHNFFLVTERCNSNCLMCSQPPKSKDDIIDLYNVHRQVVPLIPIDCANLGITGGEPTLMGQLFFEFLALIKDQLPDTSLHCLTNGRSFAWKGFASKLGNMGYKKLMLGIPLYSDYSQDHDYIVQAKGAFNQTIKGLYNLAMYGQRIEIRVVLHKLTVPRLVSLARFIYKNLPFVDHVAFMGLEYQGYTPFNINKLWIDPADYMTELGEAIDYLSSLGLKVSIYNLQLCLIPRHLWRYSRKSISDWKNIYVEECIGCKAIDRCGGFFASSNKMRSKYIRAITTDDAVELTDGL
jgi:His-Xaa-Ser system radical SAM maturase HxsC